MAIRPPLTATVRGGQGKPDRDEEMIVRWSNKEMETGRRSTLTIIAPYKVFGRRHVETIHALMQPASEKRQGTKSRSVVQATVRRALWGIESYRSRMRPQLGRYGMDIAKWGKYLLAHV